MAWLHSRLSELKRKRMANDPKGYYKNYVANDVIYPLNQHLVNTILSYNPKSVFEFGCGVGKHLQLLKEKTRCYGIDISEPAIEIAKKKRLDVELADETALAKIDNFDVAFTCSVLDHIQDIDGIVQQFKRIARKAILAMETNDPVDKLYFAHDYEALGFVKTGYEYTSNLAKVPALYELWKWEQPQ